MADDDTTPHKLTDDDVANLSREELVSQLTAARRGIEAMGRDLREMANQVHAAQQSSLGAFTMLLSISRGLAKLRRSKDAQVALILTANEQNQLNTIVRNAEKAVQVIDPTGEVTKHVDNVRAMTAAKGKPSLVIAKGDLPKS